jgi:DNA-binding XRE family transcriptional regulator
MPKIRVDPAGAPIRHARMSAGDTSRERAEGIGAQELGMLRSSRIDCVIGARLLARRERQGFDRASLAAAVGATERGLVDYEKGVDRIDAQTMLKLCRALDVDLSYFFSPWLNEADLSELSGATSLAAE